MFSTLPNARSWSCAIVNGVVDGCQQLLADLDNFQPKDNQDLWHEVRERLVDHPANFLGIRKVKAHTKDVDVEAGIITARDKTYNDAVDDCA